MKESPETLVIGGGGIAGAALGLVAALEVDQDDAPLFDVTIIEAARDPMTEASILPGHQHGGVQFALSAETVRAQVRGKILFNEGLPSYCRAIEPRGTRALTTQQTADSGRLTSERHFQQYNTVARKEHEKWINRIIVETHESREAVIARQGSPDRDVFCHRLPTDMLNSVYANGPGWEIEGGFVTQECALDTLEMYAAIVDQLETLPNVQIHYRHAIKPWEFTSNSNKREFINRMNDGRYKIEVDVGRDTREFIGDYFVSALGIGNMAVNATGLGPEEVVSQRAMLVADISGLDFEGPAGDIAYLLLDDGGKGGIYSPINSDKAIIALPLQDEGSYLDTGGIPQILNANNPRVRPWQWPRELTLERHRKIFSDRARERFPFLQGLQDTDFDVHYRHTIRAKPELHIRTPIDVREVDEGRYIWTLTKATGVMEGVIQCREMIEMRRRNPSIGLQSPPDAMKIMLAHRRRSRYDLRDLPRGNTEKQALRNRFYTQTEYYKRHNTQPLNL